MQTIKEKFLGRIQQLGQEFYSHPISVELVLSKADTGTDLAQPTVAEPEKPASPVKKTKSS
jgi:hypothetical protein